jgi:hypothetical protein
MVVISMLVARFARIDSEVDGRLKIKKRTLSSWPNIMMMGDNADPQRSRRRRGLVHRDPP